MVSALLFSSASHSIHASHSIPRPCGIHLMAITAHPPVARVPLSPIEMSTHKAIVGVPAARGVLLQASPTGSGLTSKAFACRSASPTASILTTQAWTPFQAHSNASSIQIKHASSPAFRLQALNENDGLEQEGSEQTLKTSSMEIDAPGDESIPYVAFHSRAASCIHPKGFDFQPDYTTWWKFHPIDGRRAYGMAATRHEVTMEASKLHIAVILPPWSHRKGRTVVMDAFDGILRILVLEDVEKLAYETYYDLPKGSSLQDIVATEFFDGTNYLQIDIPFGKPYPIEVVEC